MADFDLKSITPDATPALTNYAFGADDQSAASPNLWLLSAIKTLFSQSPTLVTPILGVATGTSIAIGDATIGANALAVTGTSLFSNTLTVTQGTANAKIFASTGGSNTGSDTTSAFDLAWTLNTSGSPDVFAIRVTDTARGATTKLFNIYGGASGTTTQFNIDRSGTVTGRDFLSINDNIYIRDNAGLVMGSGTSIFWTASSAAGTKDTTLSRQSAGVQQFGTTTANPAGAWLAMSAGIGPTPTLSASTILNFSAGTTAISQMRFGASAAPTSPVDGDYWFDGTNFKARVSGATKTFTLT